MYDVFRTPRGALPGYPGDANSESSRHGAWDEWD